MKAEPTRRDRADHDDTDLDCHELRLRIFRLLGIDVR